jgi:hypothetical protein
VVGLKGPVGSFVDHRCDRPAFEGRIVPFEQLSLCSSSEPVYPTRSDEFILSVMSGGHVAQVVRAHA